MLAQVPKAVTETVSAAAPRVVELIVLDPIIVRNGIKVSTGLLLGGLGFLLGWAAANIRTSFNKEF